MKAVDRHGIPVKTVKKILTNAMRQENKFKNYIKNKTKTIFT